MLRNLANIPRGLGAGGAREKDDSHSPPPGGGVSVGGGSEGGKGENVVENKASFVLLLSLFLSCYLTYFEFQITLRGQY